MLITSTTKWCKTAPQCSKQASNNIPTRCGREEQGGGEEGPGQAGSPSRFWMAMECSGVSSIGDPSTGDWNVTPCSVMLAKCSRETICIPQTAKVLPLVMMFGMSDGMVGGQQHRESIYEGLECHTLLMFIWCSRETICTPQTPTVTSFDVLSCVGGV
jgi:hypothetical protein